MRINNNSSPSFQGLKLQNMQGLLEPLKQKTLNAFRTQADSFNKFTDKHKVDVTFVKAGESMPAGFFGFETESAIRFAEEISKKTASGIVQNTERILNDKATRSVNSLANDLMTGADEAARAAVSGRISDAIDEIVTPVVNDVNSAADTVVERVVRRATDIITDGATNPNSDVFSVFITGKGKNAVSKQIDAMEMPTKKGIFGIKRTTMKKMFGDLKKMVKQVEKLNEIKDNFGI